LITHSLIISAVESYRMVEKQCRWLAEILPAHWEFILVDDGSDPEIPFPEVHPAAFTLFRTLEKRKPGEWTQKLAINKAVAIARGSFILKSDIDHVIPRSAIWAADGFDGDMMLFGRTAAAWNDDLTFTPLEDRLTSPIDDIFVIKKALFESLGGYPEYLLRRYGGGGSPFWAYSQKTSAQPPEGAVIIAIPEPHETYHQLPRIPESVAL